LDNRREFLKSSVVATVATGSVILSANSHANSAISLPAG